MTSTKREERDILYMNLRDGVAMNITIQMLKDASENAAKRNRLRDAHVLDDMQRSIKRYGKLTHRQAECRGNTQGS